MHQQNYVPRRTGSTNYQPIPVMINMGPIDHRRLPIQPTPTEILVNPVAATPAAIRHVRPCSYVRPVQVFSVEEQFTQRGVAPALPMLPGACVPHTSGPFHPRFLEVPYQFENMPPIPMLPTRVEIVMPPSGGRGFNASDEPVVIIHEYATSQLERRYRPNSHPGLFRPPGVEIIDLDAYRPSVNFSGAPPVHHIRRDQARGTRPPGAQTGITNAHRPTVILKDEPNISEVAQVRGREPDRMMSSSQAAQIAINNSDNPTAIFIGHESNIKAQQVKSRNTRHLLPKSSQCRKNNPGVTLAGSTNCKWVQQVKPVRPVGQPHTHYPQDSPVCIRGERAPMTRPRGPAATPGYPISVNKQRDVGNTELHQAESIVENILDSFTVKIPELHSTLANEDAAQPGKPAVDCTENLYNPLHLGSEAQTVKKGVPVYKRIDSPTPGLADTPCRTREDIKVVSIPPDVILSNDNRATTKNPNDVIELAPSPASGAQTPQSFTGVAQYDVGELISSLPDSLDSPIHTELNAQAPLFDDLCGADDISKLVSSPLDSAELPTPLPLSSALWETEDVIKLMSSPSDDGKLEDDAAGLVAHSATRPQEHDVILSAGSITPRPPTGSRSNNKRKLSDVQDSTSEFPPEEVSSQPKYQKCCCRKECSGEASGSAHNKLSTCDLVTMPWTEFFKRLDDQNKRKRNSKKAGASKKRKRNQDKLDEHLEGSGKKAQW